MKKTVAIVTYCTNAAGGTEQALFNLATRLQRYSPTVFYATEGPFVHEFTRAGIPTEPLLVPPGLPQRIVIPEAMAKLKRHHVIHYSCVVSLGDFETGFLNSIGRPVVIALHGGRTLRKIPWPIICPSEELVRAQLAENKCTYVPNGVNTDYFCPQIRPPTKKTLRIVRVCRPGRCAPYFWIVMHEVMKKDSRVFLDIVGEEGDSTDRITFHGLTRRVPEILQQADIFFYTPYPDIGAQDLVVLEAMATGLPCVLSDVQCTRSSLVNGTSGYLLPFGDVGQTVAALEQLLQNPNLRTRFGQHGRAIIHDKYTIQKSVEQIESIYDDTIGQAHLLTQ